MAGAPLACNPLWAGETRAVTPHLIRPNETLRYVLRSGVAPGRRQVASYRAVLRRGTRCPIHALHYPKVDKATPLSTLQAVAYSVFIVL